ncbi:MAG: cytochrome c [Alphaproteobacteria bacterium]|nr:cytochrome c [Alphaproteobacteria bacterium]
MKRVLLPLMVALSTGCPTENPTEMPSERVDTILALTGDAATGGDVYTARCASCHNADGSGGIGPSLVTEIPASTDEAVLTVVIDGEGSMPSNGDLADQDLADLLAYLNQEFGG